MGRFREKHFADFAEKTRKALKGSGGKGPPQLARMLKVLAGQKGHEAAVWAFDLMLEEGCRMDKNLFTVGISSCGKAKLWREAVHFFHTMENEGMTDVIAYNATISSLEKGGQTTKALELLQLMRRESLANVKSYSSAITACARDGDWEGAMAIFHSMHEDEVSPNVVTFNAAISAFEKAKLWQNALDMFGAISTKKLSPTTISYNATMSSLSDWQVALRLLNDAAAKANVASFNTAINVCRKCQAWPAAFSLLAQMKLQKLQPDLVSFNSSLSALNVAVRGTVGCFWPLALNILEEMRRASVTPDKVTYTAAIAVTASNWQLALDFYHRSQGMRDTVSANATISACARAEQWPAALSVLCHMATTRLEADGISYNALMSSCGAHWQLAVLLLHTRTRHLARAWHPNVVSYSSALASCVKAGKPHVAFRIFEEMLVAKVQPDVITFNAAIQSSSQYSGWSLAVKLLHTMPSYKIIPDVITFNVVIATCEKAQEWEQALRLLRNIASTKLTADLVSYNTTISALGGGQWNVAMALLEAMEEAQVTPDVITCNAAIDACSQGRQWTHALHLFATMREAECLPNVITYNALLECTRGLEVRTLLYREALTLGFIPRSEIT